MTRPLSNVIGFDDAPLAREHRGDVEADALLSAATLYGKLPEPLRLAHLIAGGVQRGSNRGRA